MNRLEPTWVDERSPLAALVCPLHAFRNCIVQGAELDVAQE
jgi:hypothetical protein